MRNKIRIKCRYPIATFGMICGIIIAYFSFFYGCQMTRELYYERKEMREHHHDSDRLGISLLYDDDQRDILKNFQEDKITGYISMLSLYDDIVKAETLTYMYLTIPEQFPYKIVEGTIPDKDQLEKMGRVAVLGRGLASSTYSRNGNPYIMFCGEEYRVIAYIAADNSKSLDSMRILFYDYIGENVRNNIDYCAKTEGIILVFDGEKHQLGQFYERMKKKLDGKVQSMKCLENIGEDVFSVYGGWEDLQKYSCFLYVFSAFLIVMVMELWIVQRKKEFAIRRAIGYLRSQIVWLIAAEIMGIVSKTGFGLLFCQIVYYLIFRKRLYEDLFYFDFMSCCLFVAVTFIVMMIYPSFKILYSDMLESIQREGDTI